MKKVLLLCFSVAILCGCSKDYKKMIVGKWEMDGLLFKQYVTFHDSGLYYDECTGLLKGESKSGTYEVDGKDIKLKLESYDKNGKKIDRFKTVWVIKDVDENNMWYSIGENTEHTVHLRRIR